MIENILYSSNSFHNNIQNENHAYWVKNVSGTGLFRKSFKNGCCMRQKQNYDLRIAQCFGRVLIQITAKDHWDSFRRLLRAVV
jgi:hypothetical protein